MSAYWEQREEDLAAKVADMLIRHWSTIDSLISHEVGFHLSRGHALRVARRAIAIIEEREVKQL